MHTHRRKHSRPSRSLLRSIISGFHSPLLVVGLLLVQLLGSGCLGAIDSTLNAAPVVNAGPDQHLYRAEPGTVSFTLDGSSSCSLDDTATLQYQWRQISGRAVTLSGETAAVLEVSTEFRGAFTFSLQIDAQRADGIVEGEADFVTLIVEEAEGEDVVPAPSSVDLCGTQL
ncbi:MAG: hypothetical protein GY822_15390 [Deltaproteobacteria bacterium]|nr:hypothetical protein [Deltaproteobacteria bacterium]